MFNFRRERETMGNRKDSTREKRRICLKTSLGEEVQRRESVWRTKDIKAKGKERKSGNMQEGGKWLPPYYLYAGGGGHRPKYDLGPERKYAWDLVLGHLSEEGQRDVEETEETEIEEEKGRIWRKMGGIPMHKSRDKKRKG